MFELVSRQGLEPRTRRSRGWIRPSRGRPPASSVLVMHGYEQRAGTGRINGRARRRHRRDEDERQTQARRMAPPASSGEGRGPRRRARGPRTARSVRGHARHRGGPGTIGNTHAGRGDGTGERRDRAANHEELRRLAAAADAPGVLRGGARTAAGENARILPVHPGVSSAEEGPCRRRWCRAAKEVSMEASFRIS